MTAKGGTDWATGAGISAFAILVVVLLYAVTRGHLGVSSDGIVYLDGARSLADGLGFTTLSYGPGRATITHFPPGYSAVVALIGSTAGVGMYRAAGLLGLLTAAALVLSAGAVALRWTGSRPAAAIAAGVVGLHPVLLDLYAMPRSEPLYLLALLWSVHGLARYLTEQRTIWLLAASLLAAAAALTRFVGLAAAALLPFAVLALGRSPWRTRLAHALAAFLVAIAPLALWVALREAGSPRSLAWHPEPLRAEAQHLVLWITAWPVPPLAQLPAGFWLAALKVIAPVLTATGAAAWAVLALRRARSRGLPRDGSDALALLWLVHGAGYFAFVILSLMLADAATPLNDRILAPTFLSLTLAAGTAFPALLREDAGRAARLLRGAVVVSVALIGTGGALWAVGHLRSGGPGWDVGRYGRGPVLSEVARLPAEASIYTTRPDVVYAATGRQAMRLPGLFDPYSRRTTGLEGELDSLRRTLCCGSVVVLFKSGPQGPYDPGLPRRPYDPADSVVQQRLGLTLARADSFARLYVLPDPDTAAARPGRAPR